MTTETAELVLREAYVIADRGEIWGVVAAGAWDWNRFGPVTLTIGSRVLNARYHGVGQERGTITVVIHPAEDWPAGLLSKLGADRQTMAGARIRRA